jgi:hypothetical protein
MIDKKNKIFTEEERMEIDNAFFVIKDYITGGLCDRVRREFYQRLEDPATKEETIFKDRCYYCLLNQEHGIYCEWGKMLQAYEKMMRIDNGEDIEGEL